MMMYVCIYRSYTGLFNGRGFEASIMWAIDQRPRRMELSALAAEALVTGALRLGRWPDRKGFFPSSTTTTSTPSLGLIETKAAEELVGIPDLPNSIALVISRVLLLGAMGKPFRTGVLLHLRPWLKTRFHLMEVRWLSHDRGVGIFPSAGSHPILEYLDTSSSYSWLGILYAMVEMALQVKKRGRYGCMMTPSLSASLFAMCPLVLYIYLQDRVRAQHILEKTVALDPLSSCVWLTLVQFECTFGKGQRLSSVR